MRRDGHNFAGMDMRDHLLKPLKHVQQIKILCHKAIATDDIETRVKELLNMHKLASIEAEEGSTISWNLLRDKKDNLKNIRSSDAHDELIRLIKWLNHKNSDNELWLNAELKYDNHIKDIEEMSMEEFA